MRAAAGVGICGEHVSGRPGHPRPEHEPAIGGPPPSGRTIAGSTMFWGRRRGRFLRRAIASGPRQTFGPRDR